MELKATEMAPRVSGGVKMQQKCFYVLALKASLLS